MAEAASSQRDRDRDSAPRERQSLERTLPHSLEAERSVLGAILLRNEGFNEAAEVIDADDFYRDAHRRIFNKMVALQERNQPIDFITLREELARTNELDEVGGAAYLAKLVDGVPRTTNVAHYANIVKEKSTRRALIYEANQIVESAYDGDLDADEVMDDAERRIFQVADKRIRSGFVPLSELVRDSFATIEKLQSHKGLVTGVPTGFTELDEMTSGLQPGDLVIVAARPSMGKTSYVLNIAQHCATQHESPMTVGFFSLEMSKEQLFMRLLTSEARLDAHRLRTGHLSTDDYGKLVHAIGRLEQARIFIDDTASIGVLEMRAKARRLQAEHGLQLLIIDYLQLMSGRGKFDNRQHEIASISRSLKGLAKELRCPIIALSQLSRAPETRSDHRPQLSDLRECVTGDTLVALADGRRVPIRDLVGVQPRVWSVSSEGMLHTAVADEVWLVGKRAVREIRLASGRRVRATAEHRLFTASGWKRVEDLVADERLAMARRMPEPSAPDTWPPLRVALLGHLIGDGSYLTHQPLRYTTASAENSEIVARAAREEFGCVVTRHEGPTGSWHQLVIGGNGDRWHPAGVNAWLRDLGIFGQRSYQKRIPQAAFRLPNEQVALLLRHLWATDGSITPRRGRGGHGMYYATTSEGLAFDVAALLLRLGIVARIQSVRKEGYRPGFQVHVSGGEHQRTFLRVVGAHGPRVGPAAAVAAKLEGMSVNTNVDTLPNETFGVVRAAMQQRGIPYQQMAALRGSSFVGTAHCRFAPSRTLVLEYATILRSEELRLAATNDLFWDRIVAIEPAGEEDVYDLTVPGSANWLADGVLSHNSGSLEQDADVVMFIFRPAVYEKDKTPETENVAEIIVAKQRNGPIGTVTLAFLNQYTRFENIAHGDYQY